MSGRPGRFSEIIDIPLPRPRTGEMSQSDESSIASEGSGELSAPTDVTRRRVVRNDLRCDVPELCPDRVLLPASGNGVNGQCVVPAIHGVRLGRSATKK